MLKRAHKRAATAAAVILAVGILSGCSSASQTYASDKSDGVYFTVPQGWFALSQRDLSARESLSTVSGAADRLANVHWQEAFAPKAVTAAEIFSLKSNDQPTVYVRVRALLPDEANSFSLNSLRDIFVPLTTWLNSTSTSVNALNLNLIDDSDAIQPAARGIHDTFSFTGTDGISQTFNQTSLLSPDHAMLYVLLIRAKTDYYTAHAKALEKIASSFTVRGAK